MGSRLTDKQKKNIKSFYKERGRELFESYDGNRLKAGQDALQDAYNQFADIASKRTIRRHTQEFRVGNGALDTSFIPADEEDEDDAMSFRRFITGNRTFVTEDHYITTFPDGTVWEVPRETHEQWKRRYSNFDGDPWRAKDFELEEGIPESYMRKYVRFWDWTHDSEPVTDTQLEETDDPEDLADIELLRKKTRFRDAIRREELKSIRENDEKWRAFQHGVLEPVRDIIRGLDKNRDPMQISMPYSDEPYATVLFPTDLHLGRVTSKLEHFQNYDVQQAKDDLVDCMERLLGRMEHRGAPSKIYLGFGSDYFNTDNLKGETFRSGRRIQGRESTREMIRCGFECASLVIDMARGLQPEDGVELVVVEGNHDATISYALFIHLLEMYRNTDDVHVLDQHSIRKYTRYGDCMFAFSHGHAESHSNRQNVMSEEAPQIWGKTHHRAYIHGHEHAFHMKDENGVIMIHAPSLAPMDEFEKNHSYKHIPSLMSYHFKPGEGYIGHDSVSPDKESLTYDA